VIVVHTTVPSVTVVAVAVGQVGSVPEVVPLVVHRTHSAWSAVDFILRTLPTEYAVDLATTATAASAVWIVPHELSVPEIVH